MPQKMVCRGPCALENHVFCTYYAECSINVKRAKWLDNAIQIFFVTNFVITFALFPKRGVFFNTADHFYFYSKLLMLWCLVTFERNSCLLELVTFSSLWNAPLYSPNSSFYLPQVKWVASVCGLSPSTLNLFFHSIEVWAKPSALFTVPLFPSPSSSSWDDFPR